MNWYIEAVQSNPILMAIIQFAILGTIGEAASHWVVKKKFFWPFDLKSTLWKMVVWSILGVCIKYAFAGMKGYVHALVDHDMLPKACGVKGNLANAFAVSVAANLQFGMFMVIFHRVLDNIIVKEKNWKNLDKGFKCMLWFWIPAHTITFSLPPHFQIGLAAMWSVALGVLLGSFNKK